MHFDDRLATVLHHRAAGERAARVQFRQLVDLLGEPAHEADPALTRAAYRRLDTLGPMIAEAQRERMAGECSARIRNPQLLAWFAGAEPRIALAALSRAALQDEEWTALIPQMPLRARGLLRHRRNLPRPAQALLDRLGVHDRVLPEPIAPELAIAEPEIEPASETPALDLASFEAASYVIAQEPPAPSSVPDAANLGALVRRIEEFQRARARRVDPASAGDPRLPLGGEPAEDRERPALQSFLFTTDETGRVDWAEPSAAPLVVGTLLAAAGSDFAGSFAQLRHALGARVELGGAGQIAGSWTIDAAPRFAPRSGQFTGYVGRFRRCAPGAADTRATRAADRVRQLLHELRTPVTAIQGFAEVIQQQTVGPVPHEYRALAAEIAGDAARMLAGFAEIERLARLEAGTQDVSDGSADFVTVARRQVAQLQTVLSPRVARLEADWQVREARVALAPEHAELLAWRFLGTLAAATGAGERVSIALAATSDSLRLTVQLPAALAHAEDVFAGELRTVGGALATGLFGAGFALRLSRAEARAAGGDLIREGLGRMILTLPLADARHAPDDAPQRTAERARL